MFKIQTTWNNLQILKKTRIVDHMKFIWYLQIVDHMKLIWCLNISYSFSISWQDILSDVPCTSNLNKLSLSSYDVQSFMLP